MMKKSDSFVFVRMPSNQAVISSNLILLFTKKFQLLKQILAFSDKFGNFMMNGIRCGHHGVINHLRNSKLHQWKVQPFHKVS